MTLFCGVPGMAAQAVLAKKNFTTVQEEVKIAAVIRWLWNYPVIYTGCERIDG